MSALPHQPGTGRGVVGRMMGGFWLASIYSDVLAAQFNIGIGLIYFALDALS